MENQDYYYWLNGSYERTVGKSNTAPEKDLKEVRKLKHALLMSYLSHNGWRLNDNQFVKIMDTAFSRTDYCTVVDKQIENVLFLPLQLQENNIDKSNVVSEFKKTSDVGFAQLMFNGMYNKGLDYHMNLKIQEAVEFLKSDAVPVTVIETTKAVETSTVAKKTEEDFVIPAQPVVSAKADTQTTAKTVKKSRKKAVVEKTITEEKSADSAVVVNVSQMIETAISEIETAGSEVIKGHQVIFFKNPDKQVEEKHQEVIETPPVADDVVEEEVVLDKQPEIETQLIIEDITAATEEQEQAVVAAVEPVKALPIELKRLLQLAHSMSVPAMVPTLKFGTEPDDHRNGVGQPEIEWIISENDPWSQEHIKAQKNYPTQFIKQFKDKLDNSDDIFELNENNPTPLTMVEEFKRDYPGPMYPVGKQEIALMLEDYKPITVYELRAQQHHIMNLHFKPE